MVSGDVYSCASTTQGPGISLLYSNRLQVEGRRINGFSCPPTFRSCLDLLPRVVMFHSLTGNLVCSLWNSVKLSNLQLWRPTRNSTCSLTTHGKPFVNKVSCLIPWHFRIAPRMIAFCLCTSIIQACIDTRALGSIVSCDAAELINVKDLHTSGRAVFLLFRWGIWWFPTYWCCDSQLCLWGEVFIVDLRGEKQQTGSKTLSALTSMMYKVVPNASIPHRDGRRGLFLVNPTCLVQMQVAHSGLLHQI